MSALKNNVVITVGYCGTRGGAGRATADFAAAAANCLPGSTCLFATNAPRSIAGLTGWYFWWMLRVFEHFITKLIFRSRAVKQSLNTFSEPRVRALLKNKHANARLHLHWIANSTISITDLNILPTGTIITLHDEWLISGTSHYAPSENVSLNTDKISPFEPVATKLDGRALNLKKQALSNRSDLVVTVPSLWMERRTRESGVFENAAITVIPNGVDTDVFAPDPARRAAARQKLGLEDHHFLVCYGADRSQRNPIKGTDLFVELVNLMATKPGRLREVTVAVFGGLVIEPPAGSSIRVLNLGYIGSRDALADLYRASDAVLHLARLEAFGLVPCEAMACGTPVICFDNSGAAELVIDGETGRVCAAFDLQTVADALAELMAGSSSDRVRMRRAARHRVASEYSLQRLFDRYCALLNENSTE